MLLFTTLYLTFQFPLIILKNQRCNYLTNYTAQLKSYLRIK